MPTIDRERGVVLFNSHAGGVELRFAIEQIVEIVESGAAYIPHVGAVALH